MKRIHVRDSSGSISLLHVTKGIEEAILKAVNQEVMLCHVCGKNWWRIMPILCLPDSKHLRSSDVSLECVECGHVRKNPEGP